MINMRKKGAVIALLTLNLSADVFAVIAPPAADTYVGSGSESTKNFGAQPATQVSATRSTLIRFDLSGLPVGVVDSDIEKATLLLYVGNVTAAVIGDAAGKAIRRAVNVG